MRAEEYVELTALLGRHSMRDRRVAATRAKADWPHKLMGCAGRRINAFDGGGFDAIVDGELGHDCEQETGGGDLSRVKHEFREKWPRVEYARGRRVGSGVWLADVGTRNT